MMESTSPSHNHKILAGQVIAVTGADQGYGRLISSVLTQAGANIIMVGENTDTLAAAASAIEENGQVVIPIASDVSIYLNWISVQERMLEVFGVLNGVVHVANKSIQSSFTSLRESEWMDLFTHNVKSTVGITQILAKRMPDTWLTIIGPHADGALIQVASQRGCLQALVEHCHTANLRANLLFPSRASCGEDELDKPVADLVLNLAGPNMQSLRGNVIEVPLVAAPKIHPSELGFLSNS